jgi:hypothetical protein
VPSEPSHLEQLAFNGSDARHQPIEVTEQDPFLLLGPLALLRIGAIALLELCIGEFLIETPLPCLEVLKFLLEFQFLPHPRTG